MEQTRPESVKVARASRPISKRSFMELYSVEDLALYGVAAIVYIILGLTFRDKVLNIGVGPLYFIVWAWLVPPAWSRVRGWWSNR